MKRLSFFILLLALAVPCLAKDSISDKEAMAKFVSAENHYRNNEYKEAVADYESIIAAGKESGGVYYNLANSYYRLKDIGRAVLNYERALQLMPRDSDLKFNYRLATASLPSYQDASDNFLKRLMRHHANFYSRQEMILILTVLFLIFVTANICWKLFSNARGILFGLQIGVGIFFCIFLLGLFLKVESEKGRVVILQKTEARFEPKPDATSHYPLVAGEKIKEIRRETGWVKVERPDGKMGWIEEKNREAI